MNISELWLASIERASWQGGLALLLAWILCRFLRFPPRVKCWIWRLAYFKVLLSAVLMVPITLPVWPATVVAQNPTAQGWVFEAANTGATQDVVPVFPPQTSITSAVTQKTSWPVILLGIWIAGVGISMARIMLHARRVLHLRQRAKPISSAAITEICNNLCGKLGLKSAPAILSSSEISSPVVIGLFRPVILLPLSDGNFSRQMLSAAIAHELSHIARQDLIWNLNAAVIETFFFFHPLIWLARSEMRLAQEMACDDAALRIGGSTPSQYGQILLDTVCANLGRSVLSAGIIETRKTLERRLIAMKSLMNWKPRHIAAAAFLLVLIGLVALPQWRLVARGQTQPTNPPPGMFHPPGAPPGVFVPIPGGDGNSATQPAVAKSLQPGTSPIAAPQSIRPLSLYAMTDGIITHTKLGTDVKKGDVIVQLDDRRQLLALVEAKTQALYEEKALARMNASVVSEAELDAQKLKTDRANTEVSLRRLDLEDARIVAPADGSVDKSELLIGTYVAKGMELCVFRQKGDSNATTRALSDVEIRIPQARQEELDRFNSLAAPGSAKITNAPPGMFHPPGAPPGVFVPIPPESDSPATQPSAPRGQAQPTNAPPGMFHPPGAPPGVFVPIPNGVDNN